MDNDEQDQDS